MPPLSTKSQRQSKLAMSTMVPRPVHSPDSGSEHGPEMENPLIRVRLAKIIPYGSGQKANTTHPTRISHIDFFFFFGSFGFQPERQETGETSSILYTERQKTRKKSCKGSNDHTRPDQTTARGFDAQTAVVRGQTKGPVRRTQEAEDGIRWITPAARLPRLLFSERRMAPFFLLRGSPWAYQKGFHASLESRLEVS